MKRLILTLSAGVLLLLPGARAVPLPIPGINVDVPGTILNSVPDELQRAVNTYFTGDRNALVAPTALGLESGEPGALEEAFKRTGLLPMTRNTYLDTLLVQWPIGTAESIIAVILPRSRLAFVARRRPSDAPFDGRKIAANLARDLKPQLYIKAADIGASNGWTLVQPTVPDFEYQLQRPSRTTPNAIDRFNFSVPRLEAILVKDIKPGIAGFFDATRSRVTLTTPPTRISGEPHLGLEVATILDDCSLDGLSTTEATYSCNGNNPFKLKVRTQ